MTLKDIKAEVHAKVWQIKASAGSDIEEDDPILILECMKMEIPVPAPADGQVAEILVSEGEEVAEGQVLARFQKT